MRLATDGGVFYSNLEAGGTVIRNNLIYDSGSVFGGAVGHGGGPVIGFYLDGENCNWVAHHNIIWNVPRAMHFNARTNFNMIFNNTSWNTPDSSIRTDFASDGETGSNLFNNLFTVPPSGVQATWNQMDLRYNLYSDALLVDPAHGNFNLQPPLRFLPRLPRHQCGHRHSGRHPRQQPDAGHGRAGIWRDRLDAERGL